MKLLELGIKFVVAIIRVLERIIGFDRAYHLSGGRQTTMSQLIFGRTPVRGGDDWHKYIDDRIVPIDETADEHIARVTRNIARDVFVEHVWRQLLVVATLASLASWGVAPFAQLLFSPVRSYLISEMAAERQAIEKQVTDARNDLSKHVADKDKEMEAIK